MSDAYSYYSNKAKEFAARAEQNAATDLQGRVESEELHGPINGKLRWFDSWLHKDLTGDRKDWTQTSIMYSLLAIMTRGY